MCGIAGFVARRSVSRLVAEDMLEALRQRGPDARHSTTWDGELRRSESDVRLALLHSRLAIRDPRPAADQPMANAAGDVWLCYNGEVYGWERDAEALKRMGYEFRTRSDTEFILHAYQAWGLDALIDKLRGMFALAILDLRQRKLYLLRDRLGLKPLLYYCEDGEFAFGSTVRAVLPFLPQGRRRFAAAGIDAYLAHRYIPAPRTVLESVRRLENGHRLSFDLATGTLAKQSYWHPEPGDGDWREVLDEAIALRTASDRPVGVFLSGGVDSTVIAARLSALGCRNIATFTAAFPGTAFDESAEAAELAARLGMPNRAIEIRPDLARDFSALVRDLDEPFADPSSIPTWYLARETVKEATVVLGGDGGDELFAGYKRYRQHMHSAWRRRLRIPSRPLKALQASRPAKLRAEMALSWEHAYALRFSGFAPWQRRFLQPFFADLRDTYWRGDADADAGARAALLRIDFDNYLPEYVLRKADLCSMAHGLELRAPLLDHVFYRHVLALPDALRFSRPAKRLLLQAAPEATQAFARKKRGFNPPLTHWLRRELADRLPGLGGRLAALSSGQLDAQAVDAVATVYGAGAEPLAEQLLQLLFLDESLRQLAHLATRTSHG